MQRVIVAQRVRSRLRFSFTIATLGGNAPQSLGSTGVMVMNAIRLHHWSFDRDRDCAPGFASPICNTYGVAGTLGFTAEFLSRLGL